MTVERHPITDRASWLALRGRDVTASAVSALLGIHEYQTGFGLWALKTGRIQEDPDETAPMLRGRLLEPVAVQLLREIRPTWTITYPVAEYLRDPDIRLGATPDCYAVDPERPGRGVVQLKSVEPSVFRRKWRDPETGEVAPPLWIAVQALTEAHLAGAAWADACAMTVGFGVDLHPVPVPLHDGVIERVRAEVQAFWRMVEAGQTPDPDYGRDGALIAELYAQDDGEIIDLRGDNRIMDLIAARAARLVSIRETEAELKPINSEIINKLGTAAAALVQGGRLEAKTVHRKGFTVEPSSYRRISFKPQHEDTAA